MTHRSFYVLGGVIAALSIGPAANAQGSTPAPAPSAQARPAAPAAKPVARADVVRQINTNYKNLDINGDGSVDQSEIQATQARVQLAMNAQFTKRRDEAFKKLDTNKDGQLSAAEFNAGSTPPKLNRAAPATFVQQMDANKDQKISPAEFGATTLAEFDRVDTNRDGIASLEEQQKVRAVRK